MPLASNRAFRLYDLARKGKALSASNLTTQLAIGATRGGRSVARGGPHVTFANRIADTYNHNPRLMRLRMVRKYFCERLSIHERGEKSFVRPTHRVEGQALWPAALDQVEDQVIATRRPDRN